MYLESFNFCQFISLFSMLRTGYLLSLLASLLEEWRKADELLLVQHPNPKQSSTSLGESSCMCMVLGYFLLSMILFNHFLYLGFPNEISCSNSTISLIYLKQHS